MNCEQAQQLFDAYLDGELSPTLKTELGAHCVQCSDCRQAMALIQVSGHILKADRDHVQLKEDFTDRLFACMESRQNHWTVRFRRWMYIGGPMAAAAVILLAFMGMFDRRGDTKVAGWVDVPPIQASFDNLNRALDEQNSVSVDENERALREWADQVEVRLQNKRNSGQNLQQKLNLTILQMLDILEKADEAVPVESTLQEGENTRPVPAKKNPADRESTDIEDL